MVFTGTARQNFTWGSCAKTGVEYHVFYRSPPAPPVTPHTGRTISPQTDTLPGLALQLSRARPAPTELRGHRGHTPSPQTATSPPNHGMPESREQPQVHGIGVLRAQRGVVCRQATLLMCCCAGD